MRAHLPMLLALSGNSPFWQGRDTGLASMRTPLFQAFPRVGHPARRSAPTPTTSRRIDVLLRCDAFPEPTFLWWDVRLQPRFGTLEVRVMDAQTRVADTAALAALVQCLVRLEALEGYASHALVTRPEVLDENRFLAARDGMAAQLDRPRRASAGGPRASGSSELLDACAPHAADLGCAAELDVGARRSRPPPARRASARGPAAARRRSSGG